MRRWSCKYFSCFNIFFIIWKIPETRFDPVPHDGAGAVRTGQLLDLHPEEGDGGEEVHRGLQVLQLLGVAGGEVVAVHGQVDPQGVVQRVQQLDKLVFLQRVICVTVGTICPDAAEWGMQTEDCYLDIQMTIGIVYCLW